MSTQTVLDVVLQTEGKLRENVKLDACRWNSATKVFEYWNGSSWLLAANTAYFIGTILASILPLSDTRLQLLNGSSLAKSSFPEFWDYVNSQSSSSSDFLTEENWQTWNTTHGQCPKFVLESNSVRIPNLTGAAIAGEIDASARYYIVVKK